MTAASVLMDDDRWPRLDANLRSCPMCGASIHQSQMMLHREWHVQLLAALVREPPRSRYREDA